MYGKIWMRYWNTFFLQKKAREKELIIKHWNHRHKNVKKFTQNKVPSKISQTKNS
jgi:hypothetical protein